jgi:membrane protein DedA with SNARE-associated domain
MGIPRATSSPADELTGIVGFAAQAIDSLGEWGVGLFTFLETVFPPIPSEVILPLAGFLTRQGSLNLAFVFVFVSTLGAYLGALALYFLGAKVGLERSIRWLSKLPLVDREDFERADVWFRHAMVEQYSRYLNYAVYAALAIFVVRHIRRGQLAQDRQ